MFKDFKQGPRYKFRRQEFWAEGGVVCIEDQDTGNFKAITRAEAAARAICFNGELPYMDFPSEKYELSQCVVNLCEAIKEAKRQGDPTDPEVRKQLVKDKRKVSVLMDTSSGPSSAELLSNQLRNNSFEAQCSKPFMGAAIIGGSDRFNKLKL